MDTTKEKPPRSETAKGIDHYSMKQRTTLNLKERKKGSEQNHMLSDGKSK